VAKIEVGPHDYSTETLQALVNPGLLLVSRDRRNRPNVMTIGWGTLGIYWGEPIFVVPVRSSRYTYRCLEYTRDFTVNVLPRKLSELAEFCGTVSGRDHDKFAEAGLTAAQGLRVTSPIIEECVLHYECEVVHVNDVSPKTLAENLKNRAYPKGDYHRLYYGRIVAVRAEENLRRRL
jgi:flavin reductase (DIM6/NTAB) family NADH-FMN oxidoreductase RutF